jgi:hypothetical protein
MIITPAQQDAQIGHTERIGIALNNVYYGGIARQPHRAAHHSKAETADGFALVVLHANAACRSLAHDG